MTKSTPPNLKPEELPQLLLSALDTLIECQSYLLSSADSIPIHLQSEHLFNKLGRYTEAIAACDAVLKLDPNNIDALSRRGTNLHMLNQIDEAKKDLEKAITISPDHPVLIYNYGNLFFAEKDFEKAQQCYARSLEIAPQYLRALHNLALTFKMLGHPKEAVFYYKQVLEKDPSLTEATHNLSLCQLLLGNFEEGWVNYEARWNLIGLNNIHPQTGQILWMGNFPIEGKTLLVYAEQGVGDIIQFSRYLKKVATLGARIVFRAPVALYKLLQHLEGVAQIISNDEKLPNYDYYCPLISLPLIFKTNLSTLAQETQKPYLYALPDLIQSWQKRLPSTKKLRIGLCWSGSTTFAEDTLRSIPLDKFYKITNDHAEFFSLQTELREEDIPTLQKIQETNPHFHHLGKSLQDFTDTAAIIASLDLIISVDTGVAHLAAALGKPCWIFIAAAPDWRWLLDREDSPWYPTIRLFRQNKLKEWDEVIERVKHAFLEFSLQTINKEPHLA
jgi:tetratricopeptide (TPR) repeat protein